MTGLKDLKAQHRRAFRSGMLAHEALEAMRADGSNQAAHEPPSSATAAIWATASAHPLCQGDGKADEGPSPRRWKTPSLGGAAVLELSPDGGIGVAAAGALAAAFLQLCRGRLVQSPRLLRALLWSIPLPRIAIEAGWFVASSVASPGPSATCCRCRPPSPCCNQGSSGSASSPSSSSAAACWWWSCSCCVMLIRKGPASLQTGRYQGEVLQNGESCLMDYET